ncbi:MAG: phosphonate metabolism protein/1,5-bisphosphokinase (PRPP-forming) PhnN [Zoogloeaceae bacterium]|nr:phosphonate metabolism protein/1,5-bisphosphokinase (PRPP-forming) PhnN [Zoogloeaceae bacterium]
MRGLMGRENDRMNGTLVYVMGPSGSGKDSLMAYARRRMNAAYTLTWNASAAPRQGLRPVIFVRRHITRQANAGGERHHPITREEFQSCRNRGRFALAWESHGLCYGIGGEMNLHLAKGAVAVVNGSREYLPEAIKNYPELVPVLISATPEVLRKRLEKRGRETAPDIGERLQGATLPMPEIHNLIRLDNSGTLEEAGEFFADFLTCLRYPPIPETKAAEDEALRESEVSCYRNPMVADVRHSAPVLTF